MKKVYVDKDNKQRVIKEIKSGSFLFDPSLFETVQRIVDDVRSGGDSSLFRYTEMFDGVRLDSDRVRVSEEEISSSQKAVSKEFENSIRIAASRIESYQKERLPQEMIYRDDLGNELGWLVRPMKRVGIYVPGGKAAYPSTVLMTAIPAMVAGVEEVVVVTPCRGEKIDPNVVYACHVCGIKEIYKVGGAQSIAALAFGTESIPKVDKIVGPGNIYVTIAKKIVWGSVDIDMLAGPSEVLVIADGSCPASWVASDLLAQAEHDELAVPTLVTTSDTYANEVIEEVNRQLARLSRKDIATVSVTKNGRVYVVEEISDAVDISNAVAPEHLQLCVEDPHSILSSIENAGAVFLGSLSTEAFGDYVCGPSHVLPTGGAARYSSPLSVYDFIKMPSVISVSKKGFDELSDIVTTLAETEGLDAHALSVRIRQ